jgi:hypothetical protein
MKSLLVCLVELIALLALVVPSYAAELKINGLNHIRAISSDNYNGDDDTDDNFNYVTQRFRLYFTAIASENLRLVYRNEIDFEWGDDAKTEGRNKGGGVSGDTVNLETKNVFVQFLVPDSPVQATLGLQPVTLHEGWFFSNDVSAARFDLNFDPLTILAYWAGIAGLDNDDPASSNDVWQIVVSTAYKAENMDARLSFGYERGPKEGAGKAFESNIDYDASQTDDNNFYLLMGELNMSFDRVSIGIIAGMNFGEADGSGVPSQGNRDYQGYMVQANVDFPLDLATLSLQFIYASGDKEGKFDKDFRGMAGESVSWGPEILTNAYFYKEGALLNQIGGNAFTSGDETPNNLWSIGVGADYKPTDTTTLFFDVYYIAMVKKRTVAGSREDKIGVEVDGRLAQKIYDNLTLNVVGAYLFAEDGYGVYDRDDPVGNPAPDSGDNAYQVGIGFDYTF